MQTSRPGKMGSRNKTMPTNAVPAAPIPVHIAYAVPKGTICSVEHIIHTFSTAAKLDIAPGSIFV